MTPWLPFLDFYHRLQKDKPMLVNCSKEGLQLLHSPPLAPLLGLVAVDRPWPSYSLGWVAWLLMIWLLPVQFWFVGGAPQGCPRIIWATPGAGERHANGWDFAPKRDLSLNVLVLWVVVHAAR
jgi:hypothetical protein